jgi:hypothetical protein
MATDQQLVILEYDGLPVMRDQLHRAREYSVTGCGRWQRDPGRGAGLIKARLKGWWMRPIPGLAEIHRAAGELGVTEPDQAARELGALEADRAAGEHGAVEADRPAGELGAVEDDRPAGELGAVEADLAAGELGVPVRNVSRAPNERDRAGQTGKSPMASS